MEINNVITLVLKVVAMAMAIVSIVMGFFPKDTNSLRSTSRYLVLDWVHLRSLPFSKKIDQTPRYL
jgi:hypothetical protein